MWVCITQLRSILRIKCGRVWVSSGVQLQPGREKNKKKSVYYTGIASEKKDKKNTLDFTLGYIGKLEKCTIFQ